MNPKNNYTNNCRKMKRFLVFMLLTFTLSSAFPQIYCASKSSRQSNKVVYKGRVIKIFNTQKIHLYAKDKIGRMKNISLIDTLKSEITDFRSMSYTIEHHSAEKNICLDFKQIEPEPGKIISVLLFKNPYKGKITYKAKIYSEKAGRFVKTEVLPVMPGLTGVMTWNEPVSAVILYRFKIHEIEKEFE
jgi:hypothetical protein